MEENGNMIVKSIGKEGYENGARSTNKAIISYPKAAINHPYREDINGDESLGDEGDMLCEFSWPPRSYTCTFCKREFRSAQALGGHMNVHRREKARLKQLPPQRYLSFLNPQSQHLSSHSKFLNLNLDRNPNPNPNPKPKPNISTWFASTTSSFPTMLTPFSDPCTFHRCPSNCANLNTLKSKGSDLKIDGFDDFVHEKEGMIVKNIETGLLVKSKIDDLDLELRLGWS